MKNNLKYIYAKINHMNRMGIAAGLGPHGGACPDWQKQLAEQADGKSWEGRVDKPSNRKPIWRSFEGSHWGDAAIAALRWGREANKSDPFWAKRTALHLHNGCESDPEKLLKQSQKTVEDRVAAINAAVAQWKAKLEGRAA